MKRYLFIWAFILFNAHGFSQLPEKIKNMKEHKGIYHPGIDELPEKRSSRAVFYSNDFSNPSDWTMTNSSSPSYDWEIDTILPNSLLAFTTADSQINSTSGGNFAFVNSFGQPAGSQQNCNMTNTVTIDCSGQSGVQLSFENYFMKQSEFHSVYVSNDGVNFENFPIHYNPVYGSSMYESNNAETISLNISCIASNQVAVWIRFNYFGNNQYFWCIDDISFTDLPNYDLQIQNTYIHNAVYNQILGVPLDYYVVPNNLLEDIVIKSNIKNNGTDTAENAFINGTVINSSSVIIYNDSITAYNLVSCDTITEDSLVWSPPVTIGDYTIRTEAKFDSLNADQNLSDNMHELDFIIGANTNQQYPGTQFARDNNIHTTQGLWNGSGNGYIWGNVFNVKTNITAYTIDVAFAPGTEPGAISCVILYEIDPSGNFIPLFDNCLDGYEYSIGSSNISTQNYTKWNKFCINPMGGFAGTQLVVGGTYIAAISHYGGSEEMILQYGGESNFPFTSFLFDQTNATWYYTNSKPKIRLGFEAYPYCVWSIDELSNPFQLQSYPNPASDFTTINYTLNSSSEVFLEITDLTGKIVLTKNLGNQSVGVHNYGLNISAFPNGVYFYSISSTGLKSTQKLAVTHD